MDEAQIKDLAKQVALKFLGNDPNIQEQFDMDTIVPHPPAPAPPILFDVLNILHENSQLFYSLFITIGAASISYHHGRHAATKDKEETISEVREILEDNKSRIKSQLEMDKKQQLIMRHSIDWTMQGLFNRKFKSKWDIRLKIYYEKTSILLKSEEAARTINHLFEETTQGINNDEIYQSVNQCSRV
ncbi:hypothetical protein ACFLWX_01490 [Chloroflexota bacterium]